MIVVFEMGGKKMEVFNFKTPLLGALKFKIIEIQDFVVKG